jgi:hypothetical protein
MQYYSLRILERKEYYASRIQEFDKVRHEPIFYKSK